MSFFKARANIHQCLCLAHSKHWINGCWNPNLPPLHFHSNCSRSHLDYCGNLLSGVCPIFLSPCTGHTASTDTFVTPIVYWMECWSSQGPPLPGQAWRRKPSLLALPPPLYPFSNSPLPLAEDGHLRPRVCWATPHSWVCFALRTVCLWVE